MGDIGKQFNLNTVRAVKVWENDENAEIDDENFKRSKSWLSKVRKTDQEQCIWNFCFLLELSDRSIEFYAPTRQERENWVTIFQIICEMNDKLINTMKVNPFDF